MAKFNPMLGDIRGSIAGSCFSRNRYGAYIRAKVSPVQPETPQQTLRREAMAGLSKDWSNELSASDRGTWRALAPQVTYPDVFGNSQTYSPNILFNKVNFIRLLCGDARMDTAPPNFDVNNLVTVSLAAPAGGATALDITFTPALDVAEKLFVKVAMNVNTGIAYVENFFRFMAVSAAGALSPVNLAIPAYLGSCVTGQVIHIRVQMYNGVTGALSPGIVTSATVT